MASFKDHFSPLADIYAASRPSYPDALYRLIAEVVAQPASAKVWEPGCGSGQATRGLAAHFGHVHATDPSAAQIERHWALREKSERVDVAVELAEAPSLADASIDLIAVAQALHWFDRPRFFAACERVLKPGGRLLFAEHGLAPDARVARWQGRLTPCWKPLAGGCHLDRDIPRLLKRAGFAIRELDSGYLKGPRPMTYVYRGWAEAG